MDPVITAIVLNYNADAAMLGRCLASLRAQTYPHLEVLLVDNGSVGGALDSVAAAYPEVRILRLGRNLGFSGGMNRGIEASSGELVVLLNFDVELAPECVGELLKVIGRDERIVAVAPKTVFMHDPNLIDNVGTLMQPMGAAFNQGIGQLDIGQYDISERVFGVCFAAALFRRSAFTEDAVGRLDESYFMYFEDVDWCFRANLLGYQCYTAPRAVVRHVHSASVRHLDYSFKYRLIERNLLRTVVKNFAWRPAAKVVLRRNLHHVKTVLRRRAYWRTSVRILAGFLVDVVRLIPVRRALQRRRTVPDAEIFKFSFGEESYYNPVTYTPLYHLDTLEAMYRRKFLVHGDTKSGEIFRYLRELKYSKLRFEADIRMGKVGALLDGEPSCVQEFLASVEY